MEHKNIVATIYLKDGKAIKARDNYEEYNTSCGRVQLSVTGDHNVSNALAAIATAELLGIPQKMKKRSRQHARTWMSRSLMKTENSRYF